MDNVVIGDQVMLGSGSLAPPGKTLESGYLYLGNPTRRVCELDDREKQQLVYLAEHYRLPKEKYQTTG